MLVISLAAVQCEFCGVFMAWGSISALMGALCSWRFQEHSASQALGFGCMVKAWALCGRNGQPDCWKLFLCGQLIFQAAF